MLLVIHNLPLHIGIHDIKSLLGTRCGIHEMILDKLVKESNTSRSVTVGVANDEEANIIIRNINGYYLDGNRIHVEDVRKKKKPPARSQRPDVYADDHRQYRSPKSDHHSNDRKHYRPSRQEQYSNDQYVSARSHQYKDEQQFRSPAPEKNTFEPSMSQSNQATIPSMMSQSFTGPAIDNMGALSRSQNTCMDYGNQQQYRQSSQFGSHRGENNMSDSQYERRSPNTCMDYYKQQQSRQISHFEGESQCERRSPMSQDTSPSLYVNRESSSDIRQDNFPKNDRKRRRSSDRSQIYYEDRRPGNGNSNEIVSNNRDNGRELSTFQPRHSESPKGAEFLDSVVHCRTNELTSYDSTTSRLQNKPHEGMRVDRVEPNAKREKSNNHCQDFQRDRDVQKAITAYNEPPSQSFTRYPVSSINSSNETLCQSITSDPDIPQPKKEKTDNIESTGLDVKAVNIALGWRQAAILRIAKEIIDPRLTFSMSKRKHNSALAAMKRILYVQILEVIKCAYPHEEFAFVSTEEVIELYKRKFTTKDNNDLFDQTFVLAAKGKLTISFVIS